ncbi:hypothetical protein [Hymenobacter metallilatus]|uniref:Uncharacterized protein n=1 Tax=Hymenobacter metallilatus TaxID=2493666 RepID=A0A3R9MTS5_9BACT|nr:hypothetical protein [Hymenobacter metallilatus]RSK29799.1 hypothetical protein EI290_15795 [Hymenobacter metallilatus]
MSTLAYRGHTLVTDDIAQNVTLLVSRRQQPYQARPDSCRSAADVRRTNPYATPTLADGMPGTMYAIFMQNGHRSAAATIRAITIRPAELRQYMSDPGFPFRLRVFSVDSLTQQPAQDLLEEAVILCLYRKNQTSTIDLSQYAISVPRQGFYVAVEMLVQGDPFYTCPDEIPDYRPVGPLLRGPCAFSNSHSWQYVYPEYKWIPTPPAENCWPLYEGLFEVEVTP